MIKGIESEKVTQDMAYDPSSEPQPQPEKIEEVENAEIKEAEAEAAEEKGTKKKAKANFLDLWFTKLKEYFENDID